MSNIIKDRVNGLLDLLNAKASIGQLGDAVTSLASIVNNPQFGLPEKSPTFDEQMATLKSLLISEPPPEGFGRQSCLWLRVKAELMCDNLVEEIERNMPADTRLTNAQCRIMEAKRLISDFVDEVAATN